MTAVAVVAAVAAACVVLVSLVVFSRRVFSKKTKTISLGKALRECDSGDLVLFRYRTFSITRVLSHFTHVGIVLVGDDGAKYIVETHAHGDVRNTHGGVNVYPLEKRIRTYEGTVALARLKTPLDAGQRARFNRALPGFFEIPFFDDYASHFAKSCVLRLGRGSRDLPGMFCSEFIGHVQTTIGLRGPERNDCLTPDDLKRVEEKLYSCPGNRRVRNPRTDKCVLRDGAVGGALVLGLDALKRGQVPVTHTGNRLADLAVKTLVVKWTAAGQSDNSNARSVAKSVASSAVSSVIRRNLENRLRGKTGNLGECGAMFSQLAGRYDDAVARLVRSEARVKELERAVMNSTGFMYGVGKNGSALKPVGRSNNFMNAFNAPPTVSWPSKMRPGKRPVLIRNLRRFAPE